MPDGKMECEMCGKWKAPDDFHIAPDGEPLCICRDCFDRIMAADM